MTHISRRRTVANLDPQEAESTRLPPQLHLFERLTRSRHYHCGFFEGASDPLDLALGRMVSESTRPLRQAKSVLDVGCSMGGTSAKLNADGKRVVGIDPCGEAIAYARARSRPQMSPASATYLHTRLEDLDAMQPGCRFDGVVMIEALQHFRSLDVPLQACLDRLAAGGVMVISDVVMVPDVQWDHAPFHRPGAVVPTALEVGFASATCREVTECVFPTFRHLIDRLEDYDRSLSFPDPNVDELLTQVRNLELGFEHGDLRYEITVLEAPDGPLA